MIFWCPVLNSLVNLHNFKDDVSATLVSVSGKVSHLIKHLEIYG